jgi:hypothetical protein
MYHLKYVDEKMHVLEEQKNKRILQIHSRISKNYVFLSTYSKFQFDSLTSAFCTETEIEEASGCTPRENKNIYWM